MDVKDILKLDNSMASIKKIESFLNTQSKDNEDYYRAICKKSFILDEMAKTTEAIKLLVVALAETKIESQAIIICNGLIDLNIKNKQFEYALKYINIKNNKLDFLNKNEYNLDMAKYYYALNNKQETKRFCLMYLNDETEEENREFILNILAEYALIENTYDKYYDIATKLEYIYQRNFNYIALNDIAINKLKIDYNKKDYNKAIVDGKKLLDDINLIKKQCVLIAIILINCYININDIKRASIIESEYEPFLNEIETNLALEFSKTAYSLYEKMNNNFTLDFYNKKIIEYEQKLKKEKSTNNKSRVIIQSEYKEIPGVIEIKKENKIKFEQTSYKNIKVSQIYEDIFKIMQDINSLNTDLFRDILRSVGINLVKKLPITEIIVFYNSNNIYKGFHYKVERVYDKKFNYEQLENTLPYFTYLSLEENYIEDLADSDFNKNIINNSLYTEKINAYSFPLFNKKGVYGAVTFYGYERFIDLDLGYEFIKWITEVLNYKLNSFIFHTEMSETYNKLTFIIDNMSTGIKEEYNGIIHLNSKAEEILGLSENIYLEDYLAIIVNHDVNVYKEIRENIHLEPTKIYEIKYHIKRNNKSVLIKERMHPKMIDGVLKIVSLIDNEEQYEYKEKELTNLAYTNYISKLPTIIKLYVDIQKLLNSKKFALALINTNNFNKYNNLYGFSFGNELIYAIGKVLNQETNKMIAVSCYHLDGDKFAILYENNNDKRYLYNQTFELLKRLTISLGDLNKRLKLTFSCGIFRYTSNISEEDIDKIIYYASDALIEAHDKNLDENIVVVFEQTNFKRRFFNSQLITHISEAIDNNRMIVKYQQVVNLDQGNIEAYITDLNLIDYNVAPELMEDIIMQKGLSELLDKHLITKTCAEIKSFYEKTGYFLKIIIPVHKTTILKENFLEFFFTQINFFKIQSSIITIKIINDNENSIMNQGQILINENVTLASLEFTDILLGQANVYFHDIKKYKDKNINIFKESCLSNNIKMIAYNVNDKDEIALCQNNGLNLVLGQYFKKKYRIAELVSLINK